MVLFRSRFHTIFRLCLISVFLCSCTHATLPDTVSFPLSSSNEKLIEVEPLSQFPLYPTGCESVSAVMALRHCGIAISVEEFIDRHLLCSDVFYEKQGVRYGPDPYTVFVGDPRTNNSYGCMAPVIRQSLTACLPNGQHVIDATGVSLPDLCRSYIDQGEPVILWATIDMKPVTVGNSWYLDNGLFFVWPAGEHCLLLVGYSNTMYYFNDPRYGKTVAYEKEAVELSYAALGKQALVIQ